MILMSARSLQAAHQAQAAAWQKATAGVVSETDPAAGKITLATRTPEGPRPVVVETAKETEFTRYSPDNPKQPAPSQLADIRTGDQVRVIGAKSDDGSTIKAERVYSGAFRTISATISAIAPDGKSVTVKDLATKKPVEISVGDESAVRRLPPMMANMLARRFNPSFKPANGAGPGAAGASGGNPPTRPADGGQPEGPPTGQPQTGQSAAGQAAGQAGASGWQRGQGGSGGGMRTGDFSQVLERVPKISLSELKPGDAVIVSGVATGSDNSKLLASNVIAGVEPILQSAPQRGQSGGGDWGLGEMSVPQ